MKFTASHFLFFFLLILIATTSCNQSKKEPSKTAADSVKQYLKDWNTTIPGNFSDQTITVFDSTEITGFLERYPDLKVYSANIRRFYVNRKYAFAWHDKQGLIEQAGNLTDRVLNLRNEGINKDIPYRSSLDSLTEFHNQKNTNGKPDINLELMLTAQYFVFANLAYYGVDASISKTNNWYVPRKKVSYDDYLDSLLAKPLNKNSSAAEPVYRQYELLRSYLKKYRNIEENGNWTTITADKKTYVAGDSSTTIKRIKQRLLKLDDFKGDTTNAIYTPEMELAIKQFQERHGLKPDGQIGKGTLQVLNVSPETRIRQILINMERSRWLPVSLSSDYLAVNIPEFKLHVYHADSLLWSTNVVVGQSVHKTVVFYGEVKYVVFSPYWNVPASIVRNEILPGMRRDGNYIAKHNMEINGYSGGLPNVRQKPGPKNSLGLVKFLFPNSYNIYLHDSPAKSLFNESERAFSHGCIRVSEPAKLANFLLRSKSEWTDEKISKAMHSGKEQYVTLQKTIPVFIAYFTAFIDRNGKINFRNDIYNRDKRLADMILAEK